MKQSLGYRVFSVCNIAFFIVLALVMIFPMYKVLITSILTSGEMYASPLVLWPKNPTIEPYLFIFSSNELPQAIQVTLFVTVAGTFLSMLVTLFLSYALSKNFLPAWKIIHRLILATMFFDSGLIPFFVLVRGLGLIDNIWVNIIPSLVGVWNYLVIRSFFKQLPASLEEAALIDGAGWFTVFFRIVIPVSMPVIATFTLFHAVGYWNTWWNAMLFCNDPNLATLQLILRRLVVTGETMTQMVAAYGREKTSKGAIYTEAIKMACVVVATVPILIVYPFLQKHFAKGVMIGAIKG